MFCVLEYADVVWMSNILQALQCLYNCIELNCLETCRILAGNVKIFGLRIYCQARGSMEKFEEPTMWKI